MHALLREGMTNPQIGERLGISLDGAKYHVAEIISKLGVENREEAARIRLQEHRPWWAAAAAPVGALLRGSPRIALAASGGVVVSAVAGLILLAVLMLGSDKARRLPALEGPEVMTIEDAQSRLVAAVSQPGQILHVTYHREAAGFAPAEGEVWIDVERDVARAEGPAVPFQLQLGSGPYAIVQDGASWALDERERLREWGFGVDVPVNGERKSSLLALDYIWTFVLDTPDEAKVVASELDGQPVTVIDVTRQYDADGFDASEHARLYLNASFVPVRRDSETDSRGGVTVYSMRYDHEFVARGTLLEDFFSVGPLRAMEDTPANVVSRYAEQEGLQPYWLGPQFEELPMSDAEISDLPNGGARVLQLTYEHPAGGGADPPVGVTIRQLPREAWDASRAGGSYWFLRPSETLTSTTFDVAGGRATVFEDPNEGRPSVAPPPGSEPTPATPLPSWRDTAAVVEFDDLVLVITPNIGPLETNPYRSSSEALTRLVLALRPFDGATPPAP